MGIPRSQRSSGQNFSQTYLVFSRPGFQKLTEEKWFGHEFPWTWGILNCQIREQVTWPVESQEQRSNFVTDSLMPFIPFNWMFPTCIWFDFENKHAFSGSRGKSGIDDLDSLRLFVILCLFFLPTKLCCKKAVGMWSGFEFCCLCCKTISWGFDRIACRPTSKFQHA